MGVAERRGREREEVRHKILDAARELFMAEGAGRVTMRRIALAIEYSPTAIYNHFEDKDALLNSLCEDEFGRLFALLRPAARPRSGVAWIRQLGLAYARFGLEYPNHYRFMFMTRGAFGPDHQPSAPAQQAFGLLRYDAGGPANAQPKPAYRALQAVARFLGPLGFSRERVAELRLSPGDQALLFRHDPDLAPLPRVPARPDLVERVVENGIRGFLARKPAAKGRRR